MGNSGTCDCRLPKSDIVGVTRVLTYFGHDKVGNVTKKVLGKGCFTYFDCDAANRCTSINNCLSLGPHCRLT